MLLLLLWPGCVADAPEDAPEILFYQLDGFRPPVDSSRIYNAGTLYSICSDISSVYYCANHAATSQTCSASEDGLRWATNGFAEAQTGWQAAMVLIVDGQNALFVDISLCLDPSRGMPWLCEINSMVIIIGYLEELQYALPLPALPQHAHEIEVDLRLVVSALLISETSTLDMDLWNRAIADREELANRQTG
ncbi:hypothetical protein IEO21_02320 [Rhodonia placenta]|uniref:Uncharacterized protein n=1 Tax=Rhodonia placenta TaxID=104341 RepID=A0A8H7U568_9APHY|nr:hypothetical protein IEO21_02320 [Postia placenta]